MAASDRVQSALDRWERKGLLEPDVARVLRREAEAEAGRSSRRLSRYALAGTGAVVLVVAAGALGEWLWPILGEAGRSIVLMAVGVAVWSLGAWMERVRRWVPAAWLLQAGGLVVLLGAFLHSEVAWERASAGGVAVGAAALLAPAVALAWSLRRNRIMPGVVLGLGFAFVGVALWRATTLDGNTVIWILDGLLLACGVGLGVVLARPESLEDRPWALGGFIAAVYVTLVLMVATAAGPLELQEDAFWGLDVWLLLTTGLTAWGLHGAPPHLRRGWYRWQLALCVVLAVPFGFMTGLVVLEATPEGTALLVGGVGAAGLAYALATRATSVLWASSATVVAASWYYGVERAGGLGAVVALAFTAALLFWLSTRMGGEDGDGGPTGRADGGGRVDG